MTDQNASKPLWHGPLTAKATAYASRYGWTVAEICELMTGDRDDLPRYRGWSQVVEQIS